ncbi:MAG: glycosyltransferase family 4 protein [Candidatus Cloacimonetes bacterium]|nr:glycosyltransferase family 4 protein [Candidatus Cloacimonadota bacterium]
MIHRNTIFDWPFIIGISLLFPKARIIVSHHGGRLKAVDSLKSKFSRRMLDYSLRKVDTLTYLRGEIRDWALNVKKPPKVAFLPVGADFSFFMPEDRLACRQALGLDPNKTYAVYVGRFYSLKGVDHILRIYQEFKPKGLELLLVGGSPADELYGQVLASGCKFWGHVDWHTLKTINNAADFYIHPAFHKNFGGIDVSWMECLACGRPVLTPTFAELDFDHRELGILLNTPDDAISKTWEMMQRHLEFTRCREVARAHLDGNQAIAEKLWRVYRGENPRTP